MKYKIPKKILRYKKNTSKLKKFAASRQGHKWAGFNY